MEKGNDTTYYVCINCVGMGGCLVGWVIITLWDLDALVLHHHITGAHIHPTDKGTKSKFVSWSKSSPASWPRCKQGVPRGVHHSMGSTKSAVGMVE